MKRMYRRWTSLGLILAMILTFLAPLSAYADAPRITITNLYTGTNAATGLPQRDDYVTRYTSSPISIAATVENVSDSEIPNIYYEITNMSTNVTTVEKSNPPVHAPGSFDITFNNVVLTDGLNKIVIKLGSTSVVASAPAWAYFTPSTNISNFTINDTPFDPNKMYPDNPALGTGLAIKGDAPNATQVTASVQGDPSVRNAYLNNGSFLLTADDISKRSSTANFLLKPGDNPFTFIASNNTKSFTLQRNIIYDNGNPFAFNATIQENASGSTARSLVGNPTVNSPNVTVSATLKDDLDPLGNLKYRYVDVLVGGQRFGPYDLGGATAATTVNAIYPSAFTEGQSDMHIAIVGTALTTSNVLLELEDKNGTVTSVGATDAQANATNTTVLFKVPTGSFLQANSPYKLRVKLNSGTNPVLYETNANVSKLSSPPPVVNWTAFLTPDSGSVKQGYNSGLAYSVPFTSSVSALSANTFKIDFTDLNGQTVYATTRGTGFSGGGNNVDYTLPTGLVQGEYLVRVSYSGTVYTQKYMSIGASPAISPAVVSPGQPFIAAALPALPPVGGVGTAPKAPTYFTVTGTNLGTDPSSLSSITLTPALTATDDGTTLKLFAPTAPAGSIIKYVASTTKTLGPAIPTSPSAQTYSSSGISIAGLGANNQVSVAVIYPNGTIAYDNYDLSGAGTFSSAPSITTGVSAYQVQVSNAIFKVDDQSALRPGMLYDLSFTHSTNNTALTAKAVLLAKDPATFTSYGNEAFLSAAPLQLQPGEISTSPLTVSGQQLANRTNVLAELLQEDGTPTPYTAIVNSTTNTDPTNASTSITLPNLLAGGYLLRLSYNNNVLATYPLAIVNPTMTAITPSSSSDTAVAAGQTMTITGNALGRDSSLLKVKFQSDGDPNAPVYNQDPKPGTLQGGSTFQVDIPTSLTVGTYSVTLMYNGNAIGTPLKYTIASAPIQLKEDPQWSRQGRYKAFDFSTNLTIPSDRYQLVQFKFYNFASDTVPPTSFTFSYMDDNLPYIDHVNRKISGSELLLPEGVSNEINEVPTSFNVYTNTKTTKINVYVGDYDANSTPVKTVEASVAADGVLLNQPDPVTNSGTYNVFPVTLNSLPNGNQKLTIVPAIDPATPGPAKSGENIGGKKQYSLAVSNTPYVIVNNIYNGKTVKDQISEISCNPNGTPLGRCISGRIVNVDLSALGTTLPNYVQMEVNGVPNPIPLANIDATGQFYYVIPNALVEGKNTIKISIFQNGTKVTESSYDVFVFSSTSPDVTVFQPVESGDTIKFVPGQADGTYSTSETNVTLMGQFVNGSDIKLTVRQKDDKGNPIVKYDRRYGSSRDPITNNPNYFNTVDFVGGQFTTNPIPLSMQGDTIFELAVTNSSNVTVTKTIMITREPLPYVVKYPVLSKNAKGDWQANINSNDIEIEMEAENADSVDFGKDQAVQRQVVDENGNPVTHFFYEASNLKSGNNVIKFTVNRGTQKVNGQFILFNADTPIVGAEYKTSLANSMKVFNGDVALAFPKGTNLMRNDPSAVDQYLTADRKILFGIADQTDGRVDKYKHPSASDGQIGNPNPLIGTEGALLLTEPTGRFRPASELYWIDAGTIPKDATDRTKALEGSGILPYDAADPFYSRNQSDLVVPTQRGTLTLKYDPNIRNDSWRYLTVYHFDIYEDYKGSIQPRWRNVGGVINSANHTITVPFDTFGYYEVMYMDQSFDDVTSHPWARDQLDTLYAKGLMLNKTDTAFVPNDPISRGEFATMLVKIFDIPLQYTETPTFTDVLRYNPQSNGLYDYKYIETAANAGIVRGSGGGRFMPDASITRQDAAVMIARAANLKLNSDPNASLTALQKLFTDANGIDFYALPSVEAVSKGGLIEGKENVLLQGQKKATVRFDPLETFTRAEAAQVAIRVLQQQKKIPK